MQDGGRPPRPPSAFSSPPGRHDGRRWWPEGSGRRQRDAYLAVTSRPDRDVALRAAARRVELWSLAWRRQKLSGGRHPWRLPGGGPLSRHEEAVRDVLRESAEVLARAAERDGM